MPCATNANKAIIKINVILFLFIFETPFQFSLQFQCEIVREIKTIFIVESKICLHAAIGYHITLL